MVELFLRTYISILSWPVVGTSVKVFSNLPLYSGSTTEAIIRAAATRPDSTLDSILFSVEMLGGRANSARNTLTPISAYRAYCMYLSGIICQFLTVRYRYTENPIQAIRSRTAIK